MAKKIKIKQGKEIELTLIDTEGKESIEGIFILTEADIKYPESRFDSPSLVLTLKGKND